MNEHTLQCMEVWGGNRAVDNGVVMLGVDAWVHSRPFGEDDAGGDVHYVSSCASGRIVRFMLADVSGHGAEVADLAGRLRGLMRSYVNYTDQSRLVGGINRELRGLGELGRFATAIAATYWTPTDDLVVTVAGHPMPLLYDAARKSWTRATGSSTRREGLTNIPLGIDDAVAYDEVHLRLRAGDLVLFYTDGVVERRNADGAQLGEAGLIDILAKLDAALPNELIRGIVERVDAFAGEEAPDDDVTLVLIRRNTSKPRGSLAGGLATTMRMIREMPSGLLGRGGRYPWPQLTWRNIAGAFVDRFNRAD